MQAKTIPVAPPAVQTKAAFCQRRQRWAVPVGKYCIGGSAPILVQAMTDSPSADIPQTVRQILALAAAGAELVRLTINDEAAAHALPYIRDALQQQDCPVALAGDFHFNGHRLLSRYPDCAQALDKYRINPGNIGQGVQRDKHFGRFIEIACRHDKPIRIGVNWGSLDSAMLAALNDENRRLKRPLSLLEVEHQALLRSALDSAAWARQVGLPEDRIVLSCKTSRIADLWLLYQDLAERCRYPLHLGLTEAGMGLAGIVSSSAALALLLQQGIGDTIRVSLTPEPGGDRCEEVRVARQLLQALDLRRFSPSVTACPGCGRTSSDLFQRLTATVQQHIAQQMPQWQRIYPGVERLRIAVMGCVVNGPGESQHADIGISLPGQGENIQAPVYEDGEKKRVLKGADLGEQFIRHLEAYIARRFAVDSAEKRK